VKEFFLGLGIFLGIIPAGPEPGISMRAFRDEVAVYANFEVTNAISEEAAKLLLAGNELRLCVDIETRSRLTQRVYQYLSYDPLNELFSVRLWRGDSHVVADPKAAAILFTRFLEVRVIALRDIPPSGESIAARASLSVTGEPRFDSGLLWKYAKPLTTFGFDSVAAVPR
jgi:hypothetical protein